MKENNLTGAFQRADNYAHKIMDAIRREHKQERIRDPELLDFEDFDYAEGIKQYREMALHYIKQSPENEQTLDDMSPDEFADALLERDDFPRLDSPYIA